MSDRLRTLLGMLKIARDLVHELELMAAEETEAPESVEDGADPVEEPATTTAPPQPIKRDVTSQFFNDPKTKVAMAAATRGAR
jgi:hypothetical protein